MAGLLVLIAYVCGSFPSAYLAGRIVRGIDLRTVGSGNLGATNVYRELGAGPAVVVLFVDAAKGALPALVFPRFVGSADRPTALMWWALAFGVAAIVGHAKPIFLLWRGGGKGVATAAGVFFATTPGPTVIALMTFIVVVAATRYVSLGSILAALALPLGEWLLGAPAPALVVSVGLAVFVLLTHRGNIRRLAAGTERRLGRSGGAIR